MQRNLPIDASSSFGDPSLYAPIEGGEASYSSSPWQTGRAVEVLDEQDIGAGSGKEPERRSPDTPSF